MSTLNVLNKNKLWRQWSVNQNDSVLFKMICYKLKGYMTTLSFIWSDRLGTWSDDENGTDFYIFQIFSSIVLTMEPIVNWSILQHCFVIFRPAAVGGVGLHNKPIKNNAPLRSFVPNTRNDNNMRGMENRKYENIIWRQLIFIYILEL